jgi:hypothetical protein
LKIFESEKFMKRKARMKIADNKISDESIWSNTSLNESALAKLIVRIETIGSKLFFILELVRLFL